MYAEVRMTIKMKVYISLFAACILMILFSVVTLYKLDHLHEESINQSVRGSKLHVFEELKYRNGMMLLMAMEMIIDRADRKVDPVRIQTIDACRDWLRSNKAELDELVDEKEEADALNVIYKNFDVIHDVIKEDLVEKIRAGGDLKDFQHIDEVLDSASSENTVILEELVSHIDSDMEESAISANEDFILAERLIIILSIVIIICLLAIVYIIYQNFKRLFGTVKEVESIGTNLTYRFDTSGKDEISDFAKSFNVFISKIHELMLRTGESSEDVASGSAQMAAAVEEMNVTFADQTQQVTGVAGAMEELSANSSSIMDNMDQSGGCVAEASDKTNEGVSILDDIMTSMEMIKSKTSALAGTVSTLAESSGEIGNILSVINDIADQTNLLALNAAIEAARAGDAGRGFAVVADEVRKLAERTQAATKEIESIIGALQAESKKASEEMNDAGGTVDAGVKKVSSASAVFESIVRAVSCIENLSKSTKTSVEEQNDAIANINENTQMMAAGIEESSTALNEIAQTTSMLQERSDGLKRMISQFKV
jgi:methyl-accepting chemotaxis protein